LHAVTLGELRVLAAMGRLLATLGVSATAAPQTQDRQLATGERKAAAAPAQVHPDKAAAAPAESGKIAAMQSEPPAKAQVPDTAALALNLRMSTTLGSALPASKLSAVEQAAR
jgi:hypothetical protein